MKEILLAYHAIVLSFIFVIYSGTVCASDSIKIIISTDQQNYTYGDPVKITLTAKNLSAEPKSLRFPSTLQTFFFVDGVMVSNPIGGDMITETLIPPFGVETWRFTHVDDVFSLKAGVHSVYGELIGYGNSTTKSFTVIPPPKITTDVLIDFETLK